MLKLNPCVLVENTALVEQHRAGLWHPYETSASSEVFLQLVHRAEQLAHEAGLERLSVISAIGARDYCRGLGFEDGELYQHRVLTGA